MKEPTGQTEKIKNVTKMLERWRNIIGEVSHIFSEAKNLIYPTVGTLGGQAGREDHTERFVKTEMIRFEQINKY